MSDGADSHRPFTVPSDAHAFRYESEVSPGEKRQFRYEVSETYLGDPVSVPVTVINGREPGPRRCCTAAIHDDELNDVNVWHELAETHAPADIAETLVLRTSSLSPAQAQQRYGPIYDLDMNPTFPGGGTNTASRMARAL
ncbi:MAG: succinylglutamate desuccinylase/aspartoacylase family protein [Haloglomus sp.]